MVDFRWENVYLNTFTLIFNGLKTITISIAAGNYDAEIIIELIDQTIQDFRVKYQEPSIGSENLAYLQSIENK